MRRRDLAAERRRVLWCYEREETVINVPVSTRATQGARPNDFSFTDDREWLYLGVTCSSDGHDPDGPCGCQRALFGVRTHKGTTTFAVDTQPIDQDVYFAAVRNAYRSAGFATTYTEAAEAHADLLAAIANYPPGTVCEYRGGEVHVRAQPQKKT